MSVLEKKKDSVKALVFKSRGISRKDAAASLDIDVRTVSAYLEELEKSGLIKGKLVRPLGKGRPSMLYSPDFLRMAFMGIHINRDGVLIAVCDYSGIRLEGLVHKIEIGAESKLSVINKILKSAEKLKFAAEENWNLIGVGVACSRWLSPPLAEYDIFAEINEILENALTLPVFRSNPINALLYGVSDEEKAEKILFIHPGNILEIGIFLDRETPFDYVAYEKEFQHFSGNPKGPLCYCGRRGCVDNYVTDAAISDRFLERSGKRKSCSDIYRLAEKGDKCAVETLSDSGKFLGIAAADFAFEKELDLILIATNRPPVFFEAAVEIFKAKRKGKVRFEKYSGDNSVVNSAARMVAYKTVKKFVINT